MVERGTHKPKVGGSIPPAAIFLTAAFLMSNFAMAAEKPKEPVRIPTGIEWLLGSMGERFDAVIAAMGVMSQSNVPFDRTPADYYAALEKKIRRDPSLNEVALTEILADYVYETDPSSQKILDRLRKPQKTKVWAI